MIENYEEFIKEQNKEYKKQEKEQGMQISQSKTPTMKVPQMKMPQMNVPKF